MKTFFTLFFSTLLGFLSSQEALGQSFSLYHIDTNTYQYILSAYNDELDNGTVAYQNSLLIKISNSNNFSLTINTDFNTPTAVVFSQHVIIDTIEMEFEYGAPYYLYLNGEYNRAYKFYADKISYGISKNYINDEYVLNYLGENNPNQDTFPSHDLLQNHPAYPQEISHAEDSFDPSQGPTYNPPQWYWSNEIDLSLNGNNPSKTIVFSDTTMPYQYIRIRTNIYHPLADFRDYIPSAYTEPLPDYLTHGERLAGKWFATGEGNIIVDSLYIYMMILLFMIHQLVTLTFKKIYLLKILPHQNLLILSFHTMKQDS
ncbi:MAG: hypothetical protein ACPG4W_01915 [Flavobacteriales bacterium]